MRFYVESLGHFLCGGFDLNGSKMKESALLAFVTDMVYNLDKQDGVSRAVFRFFD